MRVKATELRVGDVFTVDNSIVTEIYIDDEGFWIHTDDGDEGYVDEFDSYDIERF